VNYSYHNNVSFYSAVDFLASKNVKLMTSCLYSCNLSSRDLFFLARITIKMPGALFLNYKRVLKDSKTGFWSIGFRMENMRHKYVQMYARVCWRQRLILKKTESFTKYCVYFYLNFRNIPNKLHIWKLTEKLSILVITKMLNVS